MSILYRCHALGHKNVTRDNPSAIETTPVGMRLVLVSFEDPPGEAGNGDHLEELSEGHYKVYSGGDRRWEVQKHLYIGDIQLSENIAKIIRLVDVTEEKEAILLLGFYHCWNSTQWLY